MRFSRPSSYYSGVIYAPLPLLAALALGFLAWGVLGEAQGDMPWEMAAFACFAFLMGTYVSCAFGLLLVVEFLRATVGISGFAVTVAAAVSSFFCGLVVAYSSQGLGLSGTLVIFGVAGAAIALLFGSWWWLSVSWRHTQNAG